MEFEFKLFHQLLSKCSKLLVLLNHVIPYFLPYKSMQFFYRHLCMIGHCSRRFQVLLCVYLSVSFVLFTTPYLFHPLTELQHLLVHDLNFVIIGGSMPELGSIAASFVLTSLYLFNRVYFPTQPSVYFLQVIHQCLVLGKMRNYFCYANYYSYRVEVVVHRVARFSLFAFQALNLLLSM